MTFQNKTIWRSWVVEREEDEEELEEKDEEEEHAVIDYDSETTKGWAGASKDESHKLLNIQGI